MGREIRRVPPNWQHPTEEKYNLRLGATETQFKPLYNKPAEDAWLEWSDEYHQWLTSEHDRVRAEYGEEEYPKTEPYAAFCKWHGQPPDPSYYRPAWNEDSATWWQVYETVSEGTPVSPPFATQDELIAYLITNGDFWDQRRNSGPWSRAAAETFVCGSGWAPSLVVSGGNVMSGVEAMAQLQKP